ncbi:MAG: hypothetical protein M0P59_13475 [Gallionella sp.]|jgi:hypothetical protein|nr:hypothetical protein [Gallionella sp.]
MSNSQPLLPAQGKEKQDTSLMVLNSINKGDEREFRIHGEMMAYDDLMPIKLSVFEKALSLLAELGHIKYVVYDDISTFDKVIRVRRIK